MESTMHRAAISPSENLKTYSPIQVLQIHKASIIADQVSDYRPDGVCVCHAPLAQTLKMAWIDSSQIDAVIVDTECAIADIVSIREIADRNGVPLVLHTFKFDWKAKEIAFETGVDEYHIGYLDKQFIKRIKLIKRVKSFLNAKSGEQQLPLLLDQNPSDKSWLMKRSFDITISIFIIILLLPILLIVLPILKLETKGSILSSFKIVGKNYKIFELYKFKYLPSGSDKKITGIWQFLRKLHLVGLPQIINVLKGDMSLVGNYPILEQEAEKFTKDGIAWRFLAPVGIVGLWRFNPAEENKTDTWNTQQDIEYTKANTMWLDIRILFYHFRNLVVGGRDRKENEWMPHHPSMEDSMSNYISKEQAFNVATN
ncbi:MAG: sugar transferase [Bacteroidetes bacterium]|nr:sugar transferase [Bacteroidota bacterium]